jgi:hypothetical protein
MLRQQEELTMNLLEKKAVSFDELEAQNAFELPNREMLLVTVVIGAVNVVDVVDLVVANNNVGVQICAAVEAIQTRLLAGGTDLTCTLTQNNNGQGGGNR